MNQVWIVTEGEYSDYRIKAAFSTEEKARTFLSEETENNSAVYHSWHVEVFELDIHPDAFVQLVYGVTLNLNDGAVLDKYSYDHMGVKPRDWSGGRYYKGWAEVGGQSVVSREHAHKVAVETRQAALRGVETQGDDE